MRNPTDFELKIASAIDDACRLGGLIITMEVNTAANIGITPVALLSMLLSSDKTIKIIDAEEVNGPRSA